MYVNIHTNVLQLFIFVNVMLEHHFLTHVLLHIFCNTRFDANKLHDVLFSKFCDKFNSYTASDTSAIITSYLAQLQTQ